MITAKEARQHTHEAQVQQTQLPGIEKRIREACESGKFQVAWAGLASHEIGALKEMGYSVEPATSQIGRGVPPNKRTYTISW